MACTYKGMQCKYIGRLLFVKLTFSYHPGKGNANSSQSDATTACGNLRLHGNNTACVFVCNPQMTWGVSLYCFHDLSSGSSLMMYKDMQGCTKLCNAHNQIIGCRKKHCTKTNACQRILSLQKCMWNFVKNIWNIISLSLHMLSSQEYSMFSIY